MRQPSHKAITTKLYRSFKKTSHSIFNKSVLPCLISTVLLLACHPGSAPKEQAQKNDQTTVSTDAVNYMYDWGLIYTLTDLRSGQAVGGSTLGFLEGPGGKGCCVSLPAKWQPGMRLKVERQKSNKSMTEKTKRVKTLEIPSYEQPGDLYVLFYPGDEVELAVSNIEPGTPAWPGKIKTDPYNACITRLPEKECKKNLPKYFPGSNEETAAMMRHACTAPSIQASTNPERNRQACKELIADCKSKWNINKAMCDLNYDEESI